MTDPSAIIDVAGKVFGDLFQKLGAQLLEATGKKIYSALTAKGSSFEAFSQTTYQRCTKIKTLINRDEPVELLDQYVNLKFKCGEKVFDDFGAIDQIHSRRKIIITGTGGGGKTIFMKYLWISLFENPKGKVPIFLELRRINKFTSDNISSYIYHQIINSRSVLSQEDFENGIRDGLFVFVFDGFDEIIAEKKKEIERQILELAHNNPSLTIVVSGRWDERFSGWQSFSTFHVLPLDQVQVVKLIQKLRYDKTIKKKFVDRMKKDLYKKHRSFLSSPLLATMMLLTFDHFADIPEKIHLFYEQAFDTLFAKHDATKEAFKRKMCTSFSIDVFKRHLSYFCLASYLEEKFEFSETEALRYIDKSIQVERSNVAAADYLKDLIDSVCILQKDGLSYVFSHRSFQEFFAAYCLARVTSKNVDHVLLKISRRPTDNVIKILYDVNPEMVEQNFILPHLTLLTEKLSYFSKELLVIKYIEMVYGRSEIIISVLYNRGDLGGDFMRKNFFAIVDFGLREITKEANFIEVLKKIYPEAFEIGKNKVDYVLIDGNVIGKNLALQLKGRSIQQTRILQEQSEAIDVDAADDNVRDRNPALKRKVRSNQRRQMIQERLIEELGKVRIDPDNKFIFVSGKGPAGRVEDATWFEDSGFAKYLRGEAESIIALLGKIKQRQGTKERAIDDLLGFNLKDDSRS